MTRMFIDTKRLATVLFVGAVMGGCDTDPETQTSIANPMNMGRLRPPQAHPVGDGTFVGESYKFNQTMTITPRSQNDNPANAQVD